MKLLTIEKKDNHNKISIFNFIKFNFRIKNKVPSSPPKKIPKKYYSDYTLNGKIPVYERYYNDISNSTNTKIFKIEEYERVFEALKNGTFSYYDKTLNFLLEALERYPIKDSSVLVFGATGVNCDAISLLHGAKNVIIVEYNPIVSEHPNVQTMSYKDYIESGIKCDYGISISSFEHDGLGRYGDKLNPNGDLEAMKRAKELIKDDGLLFLSVPVQNDSLYWNAHRCYGALRLPMLLKNWELIDTFGFSSKYFNEKGYWNRVEPVFVLKNNEGKDIDFSEEKYNKEIGI